MGAGVQWREHGRDHGTDLQHVPEWPVPRAYPTGRYDKIPFGPAAAYGDLTTVCICVHEKQDKQYRAT